MKVKRKEKREKRNGKSENTKEKIKKSNESKRVNRYPKVMCLLHLQKKKKKIK